MEYCRAHDFNYNEECPYCADIILERELTKQHNMTDKKKHDPKFKEQSTMQQIRCFRNDNGDGDTIFYLIPDGHPDMPTFHIIQEDAYGCAEFFGHQTLKEIEKRYGVDLKSSNKPLSNSDIMLCKSEENE